MPGPIFSSQRSVDEGDGIPASALRRAVPLAMGLPGTGETRTVRICARAVSAAKRIRRLKRSVGNCLEGRELLQSAIVISFLFVVALLNMSIITKAFHKAPSGGQ